MDLGKKTSAATASWHFVADTFRSMLHLAKRGLARLDQQIVSEGLMPC